MIYRIIVICTIEAQKVKWNLLVTERNTEMKECCQAPGLLDHRTTTTPPLNFSKVETWDSSDCSEFQREDQFNTVIKQANTPPLGGMRGGGGVKSNIF